MNQQLGCRLSLQPAALFHRSAPSVSADAMEFRNGTSKRDAPRACMRRRSPPAHGQVSAVKNDQRECIQPPICNKQKPRAKRAVAVNTHPQCPDKSLDRRVVIFTRHSVPIDVCDVLRRHQKIPGNPLQPASQATQIRPASQPNHILWRCPATATTSRQPRHGTVPCGARSKAGGCQSACSIRRENPNKARRPVYEWLAFATMRGR